jgi:hypothetical protein
MKAFLALLFGVFVSCVYSQGLSPFRPVSIFLDPAITDISNEKLILMKNGKN